MLVQDRSRYLEICDEIREAGAFAWDTEFIQDRTYWPKLCLVQVATRDTVAAIDPFEVGDLTPLWDLVVDPEILVICHAPAQDLQIVYDAVGKVAQNLFDTQMAAAFAGCGDSISYAGLLSREIGVRLSKKETMTDWSRRPLTPSQLEYALDDVRHLFRVYDRLTEQLKKAGRFEWIQEELASFRSEDQFRRDPRAAWKRLSKRKSLDRKALAVLREVAAWREKESQERDVPRNRVLSDEIVVEVSRRAPRRVEDLRAIRNLPDRVLQRNGAKVVQAVAAGLEVPKDQRPEPPPLRSEDPARARLVDMMDLLVQIRSRESGVGRNILATRLDLDRVVGIHFGEKDGNEPPAITRGWRAELVGKDLRRLLDGKIVLAVDPKERVPSVEPR